jgi:uncharacterized protein
MYPFVVEPDELAELKADPDALDRLFQQQVLETAERWVALADERLAATDLRCFVCPGNDDMPEVDAILYTSKRLELGGGPGDRAVRRLRAALHGLEQPDAWATYREEPEDALAARIEAIVARASAPAERLVFNFHCPPHDTRLDEAPAHDGREYRSDPRASGGLASRFPC